ncbi:MAG: four helix bundle protein [Bacteroidales bacterium]|nr:four helix bundle protein [Bacteroidales bacterium]
MRNFRKYNIWTDSVNFVTETYSLTRSFPSHEKFGLADQLQRASVSIASNIAEGASRESEKEFAHFLQISLGSAYEVETQLIIVNRLYYINNNQLDNQTQKLNSIERRLTEMIKRLNLKAPRQTS